MSDSRPSLRPPREVLDDRPVVVVPDAEYRRLLGYPKNHEPGERARELMNWARDWYSAHGRPWLYLREAAVVCGVDELRFDGAAFHSPALHGQLRQAAVQRAMLVAVSAGSACEAHAGELWREGKPDEYFFLETYGSAVVEQLVASLNGRICDLADRDGLMALPHYSPGYTGWDVADQVGLFELITRGRMLPLPEPLEVLTSGMLRPKKSLLAVVGLATRAGRDVATPPPAPCERCAFSPCRYRRARYRHERTGNYSVNARALRKWAAERVRVEPLADGAVAASFRFDGTTCSNLGQPLAFDYSVTLNAAADGFRIVRAECRPVPGDDGYRQMCAYLRDPDGLMQAIATEKPLLGRPLDDVLAWERPSVPAGCHCDADSRAHKWGLALEAIHYSISQSEINLAPRNPAPRFS